MCLGHSQLFVTITVKIRRELGGEGGAMGDASRSYQLPKWNMHKDWHLCNGASPLQQI